MTIHIEVYKEISGTVVERFVDSVFSSNNIRVIVNCIDNTSNVLFGVVHNHRPTDIAPKNCVVVLFVFHLFVTSFFCLEVR